MNLRRLNHVVALADTLHFARAAEAAHLSQPAFSRSIQAIESDLGIRLFDRDVGDVRPTPPENSSSSGRASCCSRHVACSATWIFTATASSATRPSVSGHC